MNVTASINFANKNVKWGNAHNQRKFNKDKNKNINKKISTYNFYAGSINEYYHLMIPQINKKRLKNQKNKYLEKRQKSRARKFLSPKKFIQSKHHKNCVCGVITLGNSDFKKAFIKKIRRKYPKSRKDPSRVYRIINRSYFHYVREFNKRHKRIKIFRLAVHNDEKFFHAHAEFMGIAGHTKKGKTRFNFSRALRMEMQTRKEKSKSVLPDNRTALKRFREKEDSLIANMMPVNFLHLVRTHQASHENQRQHSYSVKESKRASSASSMASSANSKATSILDSANISAKSASDSIKSKAQSLSQQEQNWHSFLSRQFLIQDNQLGSSLASRMADGRFATIDGQQRSGVDLLTHMIGQNLIHGFSGAYSKAGHIASNFNNYGSLTSAESMARSRNIRSNLGSGYGSEIE